LKYSGKVREATYSPNPSRIFVNEGDMEAKNFAARPAAPGLGGMEWDDL